MIKKYILFSESFQGEAILHFNEKSGCLTFFDFQAEMTEEQLLYFYQNFPSTYHKLENLIFRSKTMMLKPVEMDLSYEFFWDTYGYKVGNIARTKKLWNALSDAEKVLVHESLPAYNFFISIKKTDKLYPETYLSQGRYKINYRELIKKSK